METTNCISRFSLGTRLHHFVNDQLDGSAAKPRPGIEAARDSYWRVVGNDSARGARLVSAPRHLLNVFAGGLQQAVDPAHGPTVATPEMQRSAGIISSTLTSLTSHLADGVGGVAGTVGTLVGTAVSPVAYMMSGSKPESTIEDTAGWFSGVGRGATFHVLRGASWLANQAVGLASGLAIGVLAGIGGAVGALWGGLIHGPAASLRAVFRQEAADAAHSAKVAPQTPPRIDELEHLVHKHEAILQPAPVA